MCNLPFGLRFRFREIFRLSRIGALLAAAALIALAGGAGMLSGGGANKEEMAALSAPELSAPEKEREATLAGEYLAGRHAHYVGDMAQASRFLQEAARREADNAALARQAYQSLILSGDIPGAVDMARQMKDSGDDNIISSRLLLLLDAVNEGKFEEAAGYLDSLPRQGLQAMFSPLIARWLALEKPLPAKAAPPQDDAALVEEAGDFAPLMHYHLALLEQASGRPEKALALFKRTGHDASRVPYHVLQHLALAYRRGGATEALRDLLKKNEGSTHGAFLSRLMDETEDKARQGFLNVKTAREGITEILYTMASMLEGMNAREEAIAYLRITLYLRPAYDPARLLLGDIMENMERYDQAAAFYREISPGTLYYYRGKVREAHAQWMLGKEQQALQLLERLAHDEPRLTDALLTMGDLLRHASRFQEAAGAYSRALERAGENEKHRWPVLYARGICYDRSGEWDKAEADFLKALELKPGQPDVLNYLGYSWLVQERNIDRAKSMIEQAIAARPNDAHIIDSMAWALYSLGEFSKALEYMEQAIEISPRDATLNDHLGDVYWRLDRKAEARFQWQRALTFKPEEPGMADNIKRKLENGLPTFVPPATAKKARQGNVTALSEPDGRDATASQ